MLVTAFLILVASAAAQVNIDYSQLYASAGAEVFPSGAASQEEFAYDLPSNAMGAATTTAPWGGVATAASNSTVYFSKPVTSTEVALAGNLSNVLYSANVGVWNNWGGDQAEVALASESLDITFDLPSGGTIFAYLTADNPGSKYVPNSAGDGYDGQTNQAYSISLDGQSQGTPSGPTTLYESETLNSGTHEIFVALNAQTYSDGLVDANTGTTSSYYIDIQSNAAPVPEPSVLVSIAAGLGIFGFAAVRVRR